MKLRYEFAFAALFLACLSGPVQAVDRTRLDALVARADAFDIGSDPQRGMAQWQEALAEAQRLYPAGHPQIAAIRQGIATALAAQGKMDEADAIIAEVLPLLEKAGPAYRKALADAWNIKGYTAHFRSNHAEAISAFTTSLAISRSIAAGKPSVEVARQIANLAGVNWEAGRQDNTLALNAEAIAMGKALQPVPADIAIWYANRVAYLQSLGRSDDAIATAREGIAASDGVVPKGHPALANLYANLGAILIRQGRPRTATPYLRQAFETVEQVAGTPNQNSATMRAMMATALSDAGQHADAVAFLDQAIPVIEGQLGPESNRALSAHEVRALALMHLGRIDDALAEQRIVLDVRDRRLPAQHRERMSGRGIFARIALAKGDLALAEKVSAEGVALRMAAAPALHQELLAERALLLLIRSRAGSMPAPALLAEARDVFAKVKTNATANPAAPLTVFARGAFQYLTEVFARAGDQAAAFEAQQWTTRSSVDAAAAAAALRRAEAASPVLATQVETRRKLVAERTAVMGSVEAQLSAPRPGFDLAAANNRLSQVDEALARADAALRASGIDAAGLATVALAEVPQRLTKGDLFVQVTPIYDRYMVTAVSVRRTIQYLTDASGATITSAVEDLREGLGNGREGGEFDGKRANQLYLVLFSRELRKELRRAQNLMVSAHGALGALPFSVLMPDAAKAGYLADRIAITRLPGAPRSSATAVRKLSPHLLALGNPQGNAGARLALRSGRVEGLESLPALPQSGAELSDIAAAIGDRAPVILSGASATRQALARTGIAPGTVLAFATHGLVSGQFEGLREPALLLSPEGSDDGLLTASEISRLDIPASWVILSACNTAAGSGPDAPSLSGLAQAFMLAGADNILATHWPVRDDIARLLTSATMRHAARGVVPAEALRLAMLDVRKSPLPDAQQPAQWAAFELIAP